MRSLVPFAVIVGIVAIAAGANADEPFGSIRDEALLLAREYGEIATKDGGIAFDDRIKQADRKLIALDRRLAFEVCRLLLNAQSSPPETSLGWIERASKQTSGFMKWDRISNDLTHRSRSVADSDLDPLPHVQYATADANATSRLIVFQTSFKSMDRSSPSISFFMIEADRMEFRILPRFYRQPGSEFSSYARRPAMLGIRRPTGSDPELIVLDGPHGSGGFSRVFAYPLGHSANRNPIGITDSSQMLTYQIDADRQEFVYYEKVTDESVKKVISLK